MTAPDLTFTDELGIERLSFHEYRDGLGVVIDGRVEEITADEARQIRDWLTRALGDERTPIPIAECQTCRRPITDEEKFDTIDDGPRFPLSYRHKSCPQ